MSRTASAREITGDVEESPRLVVYPPEGRAFSYSFGRGAVDVGRDPTNGLKLDDPRVSSEHARIRRRRDTGLLEVVDQGSTNGSFVDGARVTTAVLRPSSVLRFGDTLAVLELGGFVGDADPSTSRAEHALEQEQAWAAKVASPVLLLGPTGAGKGYLAERVAASSAWAKPYVEVNCASLPVTLAESELFGHVRGAFTGADTDKRGLIEAADGGTLFLDEIGAVTPEFQAKLLAVVESGQLRQVGATRTRRVEVRFLAATNLDIDEAIAAGRFREDLYFRLSAITITVPPLAQRKVDIAALLGRRLGADHRALTPETLEALLVWDWPGNVRELLNLADRLSAASARPVDYHALPAAMTAFLRARGKVKERAQRSRTAPSRAELVAELEKAGGNVSELARRLGKHRNQVVRWLDAHGLRDG